MRGDLIERYNIFTRLDGEMMHSSGPNRTKVTGTKLETTFQEMRGNAFILAVVHLHNCHNIFHIFQEGWGNIFKTEIKRCLAVRGIERYLVSSGEWC